MKKKDRCGKLGNEAGMCVKTKALALLGGNIVEKTGS
jgi:hypothetical protein